MSREAKILLIVGVVVAVIASAVVIISRSNEATPKNGGTNLIREDSHQTKPGAKVSVVEFGDFQCPACAAAEPTFEQLQKQYPQVNFVFRNLPLISIHRNAESSAEAAEAAGAQGKYWEMHDKLYANQTQWSESPNAISFYVTYAQQLGLDANKLKTDVENKAYDSLIKRDLSDDDTLGLNSTPTFYVNGEKIQNYTQLKSAIDAALKQ